MSSVSVVSRASLQASSTRAAREYVDIVRRRLASELDSLGPEARKRPSFRRLEQSLTREALQRAWPAADLDQVLYGR